MSSINKNKLFIRQIKRIVGGYTYDLTYDAENRLIEVKRNGASFASFVYNGDGERVQSTIGGVVTAFVGNHLEWSGSATTMKKYYYAGSQRVAMRTGSSTLNFLLGDHLGSTSLTTSNAGAYQSETLYKPWGEVRYSSGTLPTKYTYTGQYSNVNDFGLMYYGARWYDVSLGRFASADTIIPQPGNPQSWDRYSYVRNNPINFTDPTGHIEACEENCKEQRRLNNLYDKLGAVNYFKQEIKDQFGIEMIDSGVKWAKDNLMTAYHALYLIDTKLNGYLKSMVNGTTFTLTGGGNDYMGQTSATGVTYYVVDASTDIPLINFLHEMGHLIDNVPSKYNVFSESLRSNTPTWVVDGYVNRDLLGDMFLEPVQSFPLKESYDPWEYWADAFANYMAGNINVRETTGEAQNMYDYVFGALYPYANP